MYSLALHISGNPTEEPDYRQLCLDFRKWSRSLTYTYTPSDIKPFLRRYDGFRILISPFQRKINPVRFKKVYGIMFSRLGI